MSEDEVKWGFPCRVCLRPADHYQAATGNTGQSYKHLSYSSSAVTSKQSLFVFMPPPVQTGSRGVMFSICSFVYHPFVWRWWYLWWKWPTPHHYQKRFFLNFYLLVNCMNNLKLQIKICNVSNNRNRKYVRNDTRKVQIHWTPTRGLLPPKKT